MLHTSEPIIRLEIAGLGMICYSPPNASHIQRGENYLRGQYKSVEAVQAHLHSGSIVGFGTGSPGTYLLQLREGYPNQAEIDQHPFRLRLGVHCVDGTLVFRDLYSLIHWDPEYEPEQAVSLPRGYYHLTLLTAYPPDGVLGDNQVILVYLQQLNELPPVIVTGIPTLCC